MLSLTIKEHILQYNIIRLLNLTKQYSMYSLITKMCLRNVVLDSKLLLKTKISTNLPSLKQFFISFLGLPNILHCDTKNIGGL